MIENNIRSLVKNIKDNLFFPLKRCSKEDVSEFINKEVSFYSYKKIGTIRNSMAKKLIEKDFLIESKEIELGRNIYEDTNLSLNFYKSNISIYNIKDILLSITPNWIFQTNNNNVFKTFYAKSLDNKFIDIFISVDCNQNSYITFNNDHIALLEGEILCNIISDLKTVYKILTEDLSNSKVIWRKGNKILEKIFLEEPDSWDRRREEALVSFFYKNKGFTFLDKVFSFFKFKNFHQPLDLFREESISDSFVYDYLMNSIKIDIKPVYA